MKNWNPSRAPNAIAIRNLSKFAGRHYCGWLTKRGIGTISWVRFDRQETHSECSRDSLSIRWPHLSPFFSFFLFFLFSHGFLYSPWNSSRRAATIAPSRVSRNDDLPSFGREKWRPEMVAVALQSHRFLPSNLLPSDFFRFVVNNFSSLVFFFFLCFWTSMITLSHFRKWEWEFDVISLLLDNFDYFFFNGTCKMVILDENKCILWERNNILLLHLYTF